MIRFNTLSRFGTLYPMSLGTALHLLLLVGCEPSRSPGPRTEVRDSAGITIVENLGDMGPDGGGWVVGPEPILSIGTFSGDSIYQLFQVEGARRLSDGRIAIANAGSGEIRVFDGEGRFQTAHGRKGEGPGEFERPTLVGVLPGDTLLVVDNQLRRISLVHPDAGFLESTRISDDLGGGAYPQGMFGDRSLVMGGGFFFSSAGGMELSSGFSRRETNYRSAGLDGELVTDFGEFPGSEFYMKVQNESGGVMSMSARLIPFGKHAMQTVGPNRFYYASGDSWEIRAFDPQGELKQLIRILRDPRPVREEDLEAQILGEIAESADPSEAPQIRASFDDLPLPDFMPAFAGLHADHRGFLWVERYRSPGEDAPVFDILAPDGALVGRVSLPPSSDILEIGEDFLLTLYRDELEVEYVRLFTLQRPAREQQE